MRAACSGEAVSADWTCLPEGLRVSSSLLSQASAGAGGTTLLEQLDSAHQAVLDAARVLSGGAARTGEEAVAAAAAAGAALSAAAAEAAAKAAALTITGVTQARSAPRMRHPRAHAAARTQPHARTL